MYFNKPLGNFTKLDVAPMQKNQGLPYPLIFLL